MKSIINKIKFETRSTYLSSECLSGDEGDTQPVLLHTSDFKFINKIKNNDFFRFFSRIFFSSGGSKVIYKV